MQSIAQIAQEVLQQKVEKSPPRKIEYEFQLLGVEMMEHFGKEHRKKIWPIFYSKRFSVPIIRDAWFEYLKNKKGIKSFEYFMGVLNKKIK